MWPIPALDNRFVAVLFSADCMVCAWIECTENKVTHFVIHAYEKYPLTQLELIDVTLFNPTAIKQKIDLFLHTHNIENAFIIFSFDGPGITEQYVTMPTSTPHYTDFNITKLRNAVWEYRYVYSNDQLQSIFYTYSVPRTLILQYQLLSIAGNYNLITMTTTTIGLFNMYKYIFGSAFRRSQFAIDMMRSNNSIDALISTDMLRRLIAVPTHISITEERSYLATICGLFCNERINR